MPVAMRLEALTSDEFEEHCLRAARIHFCQGKAGIHRRGGATDADGGVDLEGEVEGARLAFQCKTSRQTRKLLLSAQAALLRYPHAVESFFLLTSRAPTPDGWDAWEELLPNWRTATGPVARVALWGPEEMPVAFQMDPARWADRRAFEECLRAHEDQLTTEFRDTPVWGGPAAGLEQIYVESDCAQHTWREIAEARERGRSIDPFHERQGERQELLKCSLELLQREKEEDFVVVQGTPGAGKSSFVLRLALALRERNFRPVRVRLRDLGLGADPLQEIAESALGCSKEVLVRACDEADSRLVLLLDGWDELVLDPTGSLTQRVESFLHGIRAAVLARWKGRVRVLLTGRPSHAVTSAQVLQSTTPVLTIRPFSPPQLRLFYERISAVYGPDAIATEEILKLFEREWIHSQSATTASSASVIGWPLLAHLAYRLIRECGPESGIELIENQTRLLRTMMEYTCRHSRSPSDAPGGPEIFARFDATRLRELVQETAIAITRSGSESIGWRGLERAMQKQLGLTKSSETLALARQADVFLVNFLFKPTSGPSSLDPRRTELGCEFIHKALREFAFAEALVDRLKPLAQKYTRKEREGARRDQWLALSDLLAGQWLEGETWGYVQDQLLWEVGRHDPALDDPEPFRRSAPPLGLESWGRVRDELTELWGDWELYTISPSHFSADRSTIEMVQHLQGRLDLHVADARIGHALFRLCAFLHGVIAAKMLSEKRMLATVADLWRYRRVGPSAIPHQLQLLTADDPALRFFSPFGYLPETTGQELRAMFARLNAVRPDGQNESPGRIDCTLLVLQNAHLQRLNFASCMLSFGYFKNCDFTGTELVNAELSDALLSKSKFVRANLAGASLNRSCFEEADLRGASLKSADLRGADFRTAQGLTVEQVLEATGWEEAFFEDHLAQALAKAAPEIAAARARPAPPAPPHDDSARGA